MKSKPRTAEYKTFESALRTVLTVSHSDMQRMIAEEKKERKPRASALGRVSDKKV